MSTAPFPISPADAPGQFAKVHGLPMYYEEHGTPSSQPPLVLLHGGGSTIQSTFGRVLPCLAERRQILAVELQAHGHTPDIDRPLTFEQDADDVAELLNTLDVPRAHFLGFSNGGTTCLQIALRHPTLVERLILGSTAFRRDGLAPGFFEGMQKTSLAQMPQPLREAFLAVNSDHGALQAMFDRDVARMLSFADIPDESIHSIQAPTLILNGATEVVSVEHALSLSRILPNACLTILPGGHGDYLGEICTESPCGVTLRFVVDLVEQFLGEDKRT